MPVLDREQVEAKIMETIKEFVEDPDAVSLDARLEDLDLGSLDFVEIAQVLEDEFDIEILGQDPDQDPAEPAPAAEMVTVNDSIKALIERVEKAGALASG
jgi:acyl carrier protein